MTTERPRILLAITVYNGRSFVPRTLESATHISQEDGDLDVLVLDDASPEPGWSDELRTVCGQLGHTYYRSPRNLGIVRNVNLGLLAACTGGYNFVIVSNSDVIYPANLLSELLATAATDEQIGSVTAWSNNVSIYSLPNQDPDEHLSAQPVVDWLSAALAGNFSTAALDVPAGISFCILIPTRVVRDVGLMDPVFGRGYCEETDWSLRSLAAGYRVVLAPSAFVYHRGRGSTEEAGLLARGQTTVEAHERILDLRYPLFRYQVDAFLSSGILEKAHADATRRIVEDAGAQFGYTIEVSWLPGSFRSDDEDTVRITLDPDGRLPVAVARFRGFDTEIEILDGSVKDTLLQTFKRAPSRVTLFDRGSMARQLTQEFGPEGSLADIIIYPTKV